MKVENLESFPANENPFHHDDYHMGHRIGKNIMIMYAKHADAVHTYVILVNPMSGERIRVTL